MAFRLTPEEDAELRRLHLLVQYVDAAPYLLERYCSLRARDRRSEVRDLRDGDVASVVPEPREAEQPELKQVADL